MASAKDEIEDHATLKYQEVCRLHLILSETIHIKGKLNSGFPTLAIDIQSLVQNIRDEMLKFDLEVIDIRLNGGAASYVLSNENKPEYNDIDLIFRVNFNKVGNGLEKIKEAVLRSLKKIKENDEYFQSMGSNQLEDAYLKKLVKVCNDVDSWSLISFTNEVKGDKGPDIELKFVDKMKRQFEFSVDSFQIVLDQLFDFYRSEKPFLTKTCYPSIVSQSAYGCYRSALMHLQNRLIATKNPEEIRGGGLLKYCHLISRGYTPSRCFSYAVAEKYMCSRFFIDFPDVRWQKLKLENYLTDHFIRDDSVRHEFLTTLLTVVADSAVCLMWQERNQTLEMIKHLSSKALGKTHPANTKKKTEIQRRKKKEKYSSYTLQPHQTPQHSANDHLPPWATLQPNMLASASETNAICDQFYQFSIHPGYCDAPYQYRPTLPTYIVFTS